MKRILCSIAVVLYVFLGVVTMSQAANIGFIVSGNYNVDYLSTVFGHTVTNIQNPTGLTLSNLNGFDAVIVNSVVPFSDPLGIGNVLDDFADNGGGVILSQFVFQNGWALSGDIMGAGYSPFTIDPASNNYAFHSDIGTIYQPTDPLLSGFNSFLLETDYQANVGLAPGATLVADWQSGRHAIAYNTLSLSKVIGINFFAPWSNEVGNRDLLNNAITYSLTGSGVAPVPEPTTMLLFGTGLAGLAGWRRKEKK